MPKPLGGAPATGSGIYNIAAVKAVLAALASGHSTHQASAKAGLGSRTAYEWMNRGRIERTRLKSLGVDADSIDVLKDKRVQDTNRPYLAFYYAAEQATKMAQADVLATLYKASTTGLESTETIRTIDKDGHETSTIKRKTVVDLNAAKWLLERMDPDNYHLNRLEISGPNGGPVQIAGLTDNQATALATLLQVYTQELLKKAPPALRQRLTDATPAALQAAFEAIESTPLARELNS